MKMIADVAQRAIHQALALLGISDGVLAPPAPTLECLTLAEVVDRHAAGDRFAKPWRSFDALAAGELIAVRENGSEVRAMDAGYIVFPDNSALPGHEWFYRAEHCKRPI